MQGRAGQGRAGLEQGHASSPVRIVESNGVHHIPMALQCEQLLASTRVPNLARSVVAPCDEAGGRGGQGNHDRWLKKPVLTKTQTC